MNNYQKFSCFIIGEGTLPLQCFEILLRRGHTILGIISPDLDLLRQGREKNIPGLEIAASTPNMERIADFLAEQPFDYLFSIVNYFILPPAILEIPRRAAINYQDSPLPKYAGLNSTSWAILHHETDYGITWHLMTERVHAGDILKQYPVEITPAEKALTLNAKCYDAAIQSFGELVDELAEDRVTPRSQDLDARLYFSRYQIPPAGCVLWWRRDASNIETVVRALHFGPYPNPLGSPKFVVGDQFVILLEVEVLERHSNVAPGTITRIGSDLLQVATATEDLVLRRLLTIDGRSLSIAEFVARFGLSEGDQLPEIKPDTLGRIASSVHIVRHESFWVKRLATLNPISLPYAQRTAASAEPSRLPLPIPADLSGWPREDFLLAAFVAYMARLNNSYHFDIGFQSVELQQELIHLEKFFASYVPFRIAIEDSYSFEQLYQAVREELALLKRRWSYLRDAVIRYPKLDQTREYRLPILAAQVEELPRRLPPVELGLIIPRTGDEGLWLYDAALFEESGLDASVLLDRFVAFIEAILAGPETPLAALPLLLPGERRRLLDDLNSTRTPTRQREPVHRLFEAQAERTPTAIAVTYLSAEGKESHLTYRQLNERANQLAHHLQTLGIESGSLAGLCMERSLEMVVGLLAILKTGAAYVPLDPAYPAERINFMLEDAGVALLLTETKLAPQFSHLRLLCLDADLPQLAAQSVDNLPHRVDPDDLAYVIYTSGSTGRPKGVQVRHEGLSNFLFSMSHQPGLTDRDILLAVTTLSFDIAALEIYLPPVVGARTVIVSRAVAADGKRLLRQMAQAGVTVMQATPATWKLLLASGWQDGAGLKVLCGGEAMPRALADRLLEIGADLWNLYGPTETTIWSTAYKVRPGRGPVSIGRPIANTEIYLLDGHLQPVPTGLPGELYIGGDGLARGYLGRPDLTAEKFIPHPFSDEPGARLYRTGDLARYLPDGNIEFLGRLDHQVKIRGFRIELGEIESALRRHQAVGETVVVAREDTPGEKRLVAYVVPASPGPRSRSLKREAQNLHSELYHFLEDKLPDYMMPAAFVFLEALPLTPNGKVDRRALPLPGGSRPDLETDYIPPRTPTEEKLVHIWAEVLDFEQIGVFDNFFELGGQSLLATRILSQVRDHLQIELSLRVLFETATVAGLAQHIETVRWAAASDQAAVREGEREEGVL